MRKTWPKYALQLTRPSRPGCKRTHSWAGSLSLGSLVILPIRAYLTILAFVLAGCATPQEFRGPPDFQTWMQNALAHPDDNSAYHRFSSAYRGRPEGLHAYFIEALRQAESPEIDVEAGEGLSWELQTVILRIGDTRFASALAAEPDLVRSAVVCCFSEVGGAAYPQTAQLLAGARKIGFPMLKTSRGDYHPAGT